MLRATRGILLPARERALDNLGMNRSDFDSTVARISEALRSGPLSTTEIRAAVANSEGLAATIGLMSDLGILVRDEPVSGWRSSQHRYALMAERFPQVAADEGDAWGAQLDVIEAYLAAFGPAGRTDIAWWTGFGKRIAQKAIDALGRRVREVDVRDPTTGSEEPLFVLAESLDRPSDCIEPASPVVNLLPAMDPFLMGYKVRTRFLDEETYSFAYDRSGNATSCILVDGRIRGVWDAVQGAEPVIRYHVFRRTAAQVTDEIRRNANRVGRLLFDCEVGIERHSAMVPLPERNAGGFLSPLSPRESR